MKTYFLMLSRYFPSGHPKAGGPTFFSEKIASAGVKMKGWYPRDICSPRYKYHTIRENYDYWEKCFKEIYAGNACLSLRQWAGIPYRSKHIELTRLTREDGIGLQKLTFGYIFGIYDKIFYPNVDGHILDDWKQLAENDGLFPNDWIGWFYNYNIDKPMAIIQFTEFRYN